ncbi:basal body-orientation factor 1 [Brachyhypopomus gauderio]|uniref:basal body-orientation factor 1 n=1 Tax=Brachyhypopomus gauderio TaxID=698409 RepID=UPI004041FD71
MPKKKTNKGKKGKGKGKKEGKQESKPDKESEIERAKANAALWEAKLDVTESSRVEYREASRKLARANEELRNQQYRAEKDTIDIVAFLKKKDLEKEAKIAELEGKLRDQKFQAMQEKEVLVGEYMLKINRLEEKFKKSSGEFSMIQGELRNIKEFHKKKAQMEHELSTMKESMYIADREHKENLARMEHKFFNEKVRLEKEAEQRIAQLAERAHKEAIVQLDDASRSVFKENVRLNEALGYHLKEVEELKRTNKSLLEENTSLTLNEETNKLRLKENAAQLSARQREVSELREKVSALEEALAVASERGRAAGARGGGAVSARAGGVELEKMEKVLAMREREMTRVKRLARDLVEQRTQLEIFFHDALAQVKQEILSSQQQYRQKAMEAYRRRMNEARLGRKEYPRIRTFSKAPHSTNSVYTDLEEAEKWNNLQSSKVDISELTWEQKERVLRLLFAKMNGLKTRTAQPMLASCQRYPGGSQSGTKEEAHVTFLTQAAVSNVMSNPSGPPDLQTT